MVRLFHKRVAAEQKGCSPILQNLVLGTGGASCRQRGEEFGDSFEMVEKRFCVDVIIKSRDQT